MIPKKDEPPFTDDQQAIKYLEKQGYVLTKRWTWIKPKGRVMSKREGDAIDYLADEWDFGGVE